MPEKPEPQPGTQSSHAQAPSNAGPSGAARSTHALQPTRYLAWLYSPPLQRPVLAALCAIESEIASSLRAGLDHHVAHTRLQWWREECERCAAGRPVHPMTRELARAYGATTAPAPLAGIIGFADTAVWDLAGATFESRRELTAYCERWAAAMIEPIAAHVQGVDAGPATSRWRAFGAALREIELLASLAPEAHSGRLRLPLDELQRAGVEPANIAKRPWPAALATVLRERHEILRAALVEGVSGLEPGSQANSRGLLVWAALARQLSWRAQHALPNTITPRRFHAFADGWRAWRAARQAIAGQFRLI
ncbi:MAG: phytoene synthase [Gammaproteobacteria bacterium]|nr:phytoene synthase [Gammaproteobacteria bacterium]